MTHLHVFMEIDTCPMCGHEISAVENEHLGKEIRAIPLDAVFEIGLHSFQGTPLEALYKERAESCGKFVIKRRDPVLYDNDWVAEYIPVYRDW